MEPASSQTPPAPRYARFAWAVLGFNLFVIVWGALVRATGSGAGCGSHWPLCNGEVVPRSPAIETLIELSHRLTSGIDLLLIAALAIGAWRLFPRGHAVRLGAALSAFFIVTEALIGAGLVLLELVANNASTARGFWVAGHLINTFLLVACLTLTAWWASGGRPVSFRDRGLTAVLAVALAAVLLLGVSGAVTALGDTLFPASTLAEAEAQTFSETAHLFVRLRVWHPTLAVITGVLLLFVALHAGSRGSDDRGRGFALALVSLYGAQIIAGLLNVWFLAPVALQLGHLLLADLVWICLILLAASALADESPVANPVQRRTDPLAAAVSRNAPR